MPPRDSSKNSLQSPQTPSEESVHPASNRPRAGIADQATLRITSPGKVLGPEQEREPVAGQEQAAVPSLPLSRAPCGDFGTHFSSQDVLAGRFRIVRFIGRGGMGEVYEAEDLELHERVAIKTVRAEIAPDARSIQRFKREINLARRVTHRNVCRTFDVFRHVVQLPDGTTRETAFLTMELLEGETLAERLRRAGRMNTSESFPLVVQMAAALSAAHKEHIVHRDFKSQNVMLVRSRREPVDVQADQISEQRVVVTDFGLARVVSDDAGSSSTMGDFVGSPSYMAPEQVEGRTVTAATDIYALGIVMYEMVSGTQPFVGETPLSTAIKRLKEPAPSPRLQVPDLEARWETVILRCLERQPEDRFADASEVVDALRGAGIATGTRAWSRRLLIASGTILLLVALVLAYALLRGRSTQPAKSAVASSGPPDAVIMPRPSTTISPGASPTLRRTEPVQPHDRQAGRKIQGQALSSNTGIRGISGPAKVLTDSALLLYREGNLEAARHIFEDAAVKLNASGDRAGEAQVLNRIAGILDQEGSIDRARETQDKALSIYATMGDTAGVAQALDVAVHVLMHSGDLKAARDKNEQQLRIEQQLGDKSGLAEAEYDRGLLLEEQGDLSAARESLQQSLATRTGIGETQAATEARAALAELFTHEGRYSEAEISARQAAEEFRKQGAATSEASALITVAESLLAQGKYSDAQKEVDRAGALLKQSQNRYVTCIFAIAGVRLRAGLDASQPNGTAIDDAERQLAGIVKVAKKDGLLGLEFRARLALGEIQIKAGNVRSGRPRLAALERQASGTGFGLIAREAERARHKDSKS